MPGETTGKRGVKRGSPNTPKRPQSGPYARTAGFGDGRWCLLQAAAFSARQRHAEATRARPQPSLSRGPTTIPIYHLRERANRTRGNCSVNTMFHKISTQDRTHARERHTKRTHERRQPQRHECTHQHAANYTATNYNYFCFRFHR